MLIAKPRCEHTFFKHYSILAWDGLELSVFAYGYIIVAKMNALFCPFLNLKIVWNSPMPPTKLFCGAYGGPSCLVYCCTTAHFIMLQMSSSHKLRSYITFHTAGDQTGKRRYGNLQACLSDCYVPYCSCMGVLALCGHLQSV